jgi:hypothetical protein
MSTNGNSVPVVPSPALTLYVTISKAMVGDRYQWSFSIYNNSPEEWLTFEAVQAEENGPWQLATHDLDWRLLPNSVDEFNLGQVGDAWFNDIREKSSEVLVSGQATAEARNVSKRYVYEVLDVMLGLGLFTANVAERVKRLFEPYSGALYTEGGPVQPPGYYPEQ